MSTERRIWCSDHLRAALKLTAGIGAPPAPRSPRDDPVGQQAGKEGSSPGTPPVLPDRPAGRLCLHLLHDGAWTASVDLRSPPRPPADPAPSPRLGTSRGLSGRSGVGALLLR